MTEEEIKCRFCHREATCMHEDELDEHEDRMIPVCWACANIIRDGIKGALNERGFWHSNCNPRRAKR